MNYITEDMMDMMDPALMFAIPRLAIVWLVPHLIIIICVILYTYLCTYICMYSESSLIHHSLFSKNMVY